MARTGDSFLPAVREISSMRRSNLAAVVEELKIKHHQHQVMTCSRCREVEHKNAEVRKRFFLEIQHVRQGTQKCLTQLMRYMSRQALKTFEASLQLDVHFFSEDDIAATEITEVTVEVESLSSRAKHSDDQTEQIRQLQKMIEDLEDELTKLHEMNAKLLAANQAFQAEIDSKHAPAMLLSREVQTDETMEHLMHYEPAPCGPDSFLSPLSGSSFSMVERAAADLYDHLPKDSGDARIANDSLNAGGADGKSTFCSTAGSSTTLEASTAAARETQLGEGSKSAGQHTHLPNDEGGSQSRGSADDRDDQNHKDTVERGDAGEPGTSAKRHNASSGAAASGGMSATSTTEGDLLGNAESSSMRTPGDEAGFRQQPPESTKWGYNGEAHRAKAFEDQQSADMHEIDDGTVPSAAELVRKEMPPYLQGTSLHARARPGTPVNRHKHSYAKKVRSHPNLSATGEAVNGVTVTPKPGPLSIGSSLRADNKTWSQVQTQHPQLIEATEPYIAHVWELNPRGQGRDSVRRALLELGAIRHPVSAHPLRLSKALPTQSMRCYAGGNLLPASMDDAELLQRFYRRSTPQAHRIA